LRVEERLYLGKLVEVSQGSDKLTFNCFFESEVRGPQSEVPAILGKLRTADFGLPTLYRPVKAANRNIAR